MLVFSLMQKIPAPLAPVTLVIGYLFEGLIRMRNRLYSAGWLPQHRLAHPVISIGNLTMGGTGKTPLVIYTAQALLKLGFLPAVLTRGYRRSGKERRHVLAPEAGFSADAAVLGDEPALIRRHLPAIWMGICKNRYLAGCAIAQKCARVVFVLDDGFQHRKLHRDLDLVVIDPSQPLKSNQVFPRGTLREPTEELRRCHVAVINAGPESSTGKVAEEHIRAINPNLIIFHCRQFISRMVPFLSWQKGTECPNASSIRSVFLVASLGNPHRFHHDVQQFGLVVCGSRYFRDHYWLKPKDWQVCIEQARHCGAQAILTTEKDAVKITTPPDFPLLVAIQSVEMCNEAFFTRTLLKYVGRF